MNTELKRNGMVALTFLAFCGAHCAWATSLGIRGARPDFILITCLVISQFMGMTGAAGFGFLGGLVTASFAAPAAGGFGSLVVSRTIACAIVGWLEERVFRDHPLIAMAIVPVGTLIAESLFFLFDPQHNVIQWGRNVVLEAVYNAVLSVPMYYIIRACIAPRKLASTGKS